MDMVVPEIKTKKYKKIGVSKQQRNRFLQELDRQGSVYICPCCKRLIYRGFMEVGHIIPESKGGANDFYNYVAMCPECNNKLQANDLRLDEAVQDIKPDFLKSLLYFEGENNLFHQFVMDKNKTSKIIRVDFSKVAV